MEQLIINLLKILQEEAERTLEYTSLDEIQNHQETLNLYLALQNYKKRYL